MDLGIKKELRFGSLVDYGKLVNKKGILNDGLRALVSECFVRFVTNLDVRFQYYVQTPIVYCRVELVEPGFTRSILDFTVIYITLITLSP